MTESEETTHFLDYWRIIRSRLEIVISVFFLVALTGIGITYMWMPKVYKASSRIQVTKQLPDDLDGRNIEQFVRYDPFFIRTQFEIIQSRPIMEEVINRLNLNEKIGRAYGYYELLGKNRSFDRTLKMLKKSIKVQQYKDTDLIEVQIYMSEPKDTVRQDVAAIANTIVDVYKDQSFKKSKDKEMAFLAAVNDALTKASNEVIEAEQKVEEVRKKYNIVTTERGGTLNDPILIFVTEELIKARQEFDEKRIIYEKINSLSQEELLDAITKIVPDKPLEDLVADKRKNIIQLSGLNETLGANHPEILSLKKSIEEIQKKIDEALKAHLTAIKTNYDIAKRQLESLEAEHSKLKQDEIQTTSTDILEWKKANEVLTHARQGRDKLEESFRMENIKRSLPKSPVMVIEEAKVPADDDFVSPKYIINIVISIIVGFLAGLALAFFVEYLDTSMKTIDEIEQSMGLPVIGVIAQKVKPLTDKKANPGHGEAYRLLRTNLVFSKKFQNGKTVCVTSGSVGEGKSLTVFNLAFICAQLGGRVLLVDADLHRPTQHKILNLQNNSGLINVLSGDISLQDAITATNVANLDFLSSGKTSTYIHGLLNNPVLKDIIRELKENYDYIFFDAPPAIGVSDASLLVREMDGVLLVIQHRKYPKSVSIRARDMISNIGGNTIGIVMNNINIAKDYSSYYYQEHYKNYPNKAG